MADLYKFKNRKGENFFKKYIYYIFILIFLISLILEATFFTFPFLVIFSLLLYMIDNSNKSLILIFLFSFALDVLKVSRLGVTPLFIFGALFLLERYEKKFELKSLSGILLVISSSGIIYSKISNYTVINLYSILIYILLFFSIGAFFKRIF